MTTTSYQSGAAGGSAGAPTPPKSRTDRATTIVIQFSQLKFPDRTSHSWVAIIRQAAAVAIGCGVNRSTGTTSWVKWFAATSIRWTGFGR